MKENEIETRLRDAKKIGEEMGEKKGRAEGKRETALKMLKKNFDIADISELTGLSAKEIRGLTDKRA
jgi:predicted transposase/invertase (TIGR01784 family)